MSRNLELLERAERDAQLLQKSVFSNQPAQVRQADPQGAVPASPSRHPSSHLTKCTKAQLSALVENLFVSSSAEGPRAVGFCGVDDDTGASWISACVAEMAAGRLSGDVCLVDANVCNPNLHDQFGLENQYGLAEALRDKLSVSLYLRRLKSNFVFLSGGAQFVGNGQSISSDAIRSCFADLRAAFDYLLINLGSSTTSHDAILMSQCMDGIVLVLEANATPRALAHETKVAFEGAGVNLFGAVLHNRDFPVPKTFEFILQRLI